MKFYRAITITENTPIELKRCTGIKVSIEYIKDSYRFSRGYYAHVDPIEDRGSYAVSHGGAGIGKTYALNEVGRKSKKAEAEAIEIVRYNLPMFFSDVAIQCSFKLNSNDPVIEVDE